ncbi:GNAT family N-acetyltransferase [Bacillus carboniphilus]|uniref:GNAT family N-acetyltransferase n=1 Tax=Bacillus carboniphilus TaxID=86663 RepID=A0ABP3FI47_9BACI
MQVKTVFSPFPTLETERLVLRPITKDDAADIFHYASQPEVSKHVTWEAHQTLEDTYRFIDFALNQYEAGGIAPWVMILKDTNQLIGTIDFVSWNQKHEVAEIGYVCSPDHWGKGYTPEASKELIRLGIEEMGLTRIQARTFTENDNSQRVLMKLGMKYEGTMRKSLKFKGKTWDVTMYSILKDEYEG